jgi:hypothetical protein
MVVQDGTIRGGRSVREREHVLGDDVELDLARAAGNDDATRSTSSHARDVFEPWRLETDVVLLLRSCTAGTMVSARRARYACTVSTSAKVDLEIEVPEDLARLHLPEGVDRRLQALLDKQDGGTPLTPDEQAEAEGLVDLADLLTLLRLRASRGTPTPG